MWAGFLRNQTSISRTCLSIYQSFALWRSWKQLMQLKLQMVLFLLYILEKRSNPTNNGNPPKSMWCKKSLKNKCVQNPIFQEKLWTAKQSTIFVEATFNNEWGSGLDRNGTQNTKPDHWPGSNTLGLLLKKLSKKVRKRKLSDSANRKHKQPNREQSKQRNIVQMLKELRTASDSEVSGCNPDSDSSSDEK